LFTYCIVIVIRLRSKVTSFGHLSKSHHGQSFQTLHNIIGTLATMMRFITTALPLWISLSSKSSLAANATDESLVDGEIDFAGCATKR
jgi:hypothetical protein